MPNLTFLSEHFRKVSFTFFRNRLLSSSYMLLLIWCGVSALPPPPSLDCCVCVCGFVVYRMQQACIVFICDKQLWMRRVEKPLWFNNLWLEWFIKPRQWFILNNFVQIFISLNFEILFNFSNEFVFLQRLITILERNFVKISQKHVWVSLDVCNGI